MTVRELFEDKETLAAMNLMAIAFIYIGRGTFGMLLILCLCMEALCFCFKGMRELLKVGTGTMREDFAQLKRTLPYMLAAFCLIAITAWLEVNLYGPRK